jgi:predicted DNA repair protein MutK
MPAAGLLALLDDLALGAQKIATMAAATSADDIAAMAATGTTKATGVVIDDMAVTAGGMTGIHNDRETDFVWQVAKGSFKNKMYYLVPGALAINFTIPAVMPWLLMMGGAFLAYEGTEKVLHAVRHQKHHDPSHDLPVAKARTPADILAYEKTLVANAIKTDFVLSAEIVAISLAAMTSFSTPIGQAVALSVAAIGMTAGVYGAVWGLVKIDDLGEWMKKKGQARGNRVLQHSGQKVITSAPGLFKGIGVIGTAAMLAVGGGLIMHGLHAVPGVESAMHGLTHAIEHVVPVVGGALATVAEYTVFGVLALATGAATIAGKLPERLGRVVEAGQTLTNKLRQRFFSASVAPVATAPSPKADQNPQSEVAPSRSLNSISAPAAIQLGTQPKPVTTTPKPDEGCRPG